MVLFTLKSNFFICASEKTIPNHLTMVLMFIFAEDNLYEYYEQNVYCHCGRRSVPDG